MALLEKCNTLLKSDSDMIEGIATIVQTNSAVSQRGGVTNAKSPKAPFVAAMW